MRTQIIRSSDIARCPHRILTVGHYRDDGSCRCATPDGGEPRACSACGSEDPDHVAYVILHGLCVS